MKKNKTWKVSDFNKFVSGSRAQVSLEYLLTISFAVVLVIAVTIIALNISKIADEAQLKVIESRENSVATLMS